MNLNSTFSIQKDVGISLKFSLNVLILFLFPFKFLKSFILYTEDRKMWLTQNYIFPAESWGYTVLVPSAELQLKQNEDPKKHDLASGHVKKWNWLHIGV